MSNTSRPTLPYDQRRSPILFTDEDGTTGETAYAINYEELYNLKGRLLTLVDATFPDLQQRKAQKDLVWQALQHWMHDITGPQDVAGVTHYDQSSPLVTG